MKQTSSKQKNCPPPSAGSTFQVWVICGLLLLAVGLVFGQTVHYGFVNFDDPKYATYHVEHGLTWEGVSWAFTNRYADNWQPMTWLSYMLDYQAYGQSAGGIHFTNVLLHGATAVLLFLVLRQMTGAFWRSAFVAMLFAIHPLRAESVAWVSERKDVLSGLFFMLTLAAYASYAKRPFSFVRYFPVILLFAMGLMAKPMLVTLPFVLLLLDYWPLGRMVPGGNRTSWPLVFGQLVLEKIPMFVLAAGFCTLTMWAQTKAIVPGEELSFPMRVANALISYVAYLVKLIHPTNLIVSYPGVNVAPLAWEIAGSVLILATLSISAWVWRRRHPYFWVGWLWYLGMLVPVIGLIQVGNQGMADRYTYLPQIGLGIALAWGLGEWCRFRPSIRRACWIASMAAFIILIWNAYKQTSVWRDSETLWSHVLECIPENGASANRGPGTSRTFFGPNYALARAHNGLGGELLNRGLLTEAVMHLEKALEFDPYYATAHYNLGIALANLGFRKEAMTQFQKALQIDPNYDAAHNNWGVILISFGKFDEAMIHFKKAIEIDPEDTEACNNLGNVLADTGHWDEAAAQYRKVLEMNPDDVLAEKNLAWQLATAPQASNRNGVEAIELANQANQFLGGTNSEVLGILAAAYAEAGRFSDALSTAHAALNMAQKQKNDVLVEALRNQIALYEVGKPFRQWLPAQAVPPNSDSADPTNRQTE